MKSRSPAVAGLFYPDDPTELCTQVTRFIAQGKHSQLSPKAIIAPHAGYLYSGPVAGSAYRCLRAMAHKIERVILLGPSHRLGFSGIATPSEECFSSPLGEVPLDTHAIEQINLLPYVSTIDAAHRGEHSLEVQLPFLQTVLGEFELIPLVVGDATAEQVAAVIEQLWQDQQTLVVVSSDLSHYHAYDSACQLDLETSEAIERCSTTLQGHQACGCRPLNGLLQVCRKRHLQVSTIDLRNSGDTAGDKTRVVGYGAYIIH